MRKYQTLMILIFLLTGCELTPMQKLESNQLFDDMTPAFWHVQYEKNKPLYLEAKTYCHEHKEKPNCAAVNDAVFWINGKEISDKRIEERKKKPLKEFILY